MSVLGNRFLNGLSTEGIGRDKTDQHGVCPCLPSPLMAPCSEGDSIFSELGSSVDSVIQCLWLWDKGRGGGLFTAAA